MKNHKIIGLLYLSIAIIGGFSMGYAPMQLIDIHNIPDTLQLLKQNLQLFQFSILGDGIVVILELFITILLFQFFEKTNKTWSEIAKLSRYAMAIIMALNLVNYIIPLHSINNKTTPNSLLNFCLQAHFYTVYIWQVFFGIHMIALAVLTCKHPKFSKILSVLLLLGGIGYLLDCTVYFTGIQNNIFTTIANILLGAAVLSELSFAILLIVKRIED